jgi:hypothetical protein
MGNLNCLKNEIGEKEMSEIISNNDIFVIVSPVKAEKLSNSSQVNYNINYTNSEMTKLLKVTLIALSQQLQCLVCIIITNQKNNLQTITTNFNYNF